MKYSECKTEQSFKMEWIRRNRKYYMAVFCVETEETVKGFPDVLAVAEKDNCCQIPYFLEFKKARNGFVEFQPTQPAFYRKNLGLFISMIALVENKGKQYIIILPACIVLDKLGKGLRLDLRPFCTEQTEVKEV